MMTHDVFNQSPDLVDFNLFESDPVLIEAVKRGKGKSAIQSLTGFGEMLGRADILEKAELANRHTPELVSFDRKGRRVDRVDFHPSYHDFMQLSMQQGLHCSVWDHLGQLDKGMIGAAVGRGAGIYLMNQVEPGHVCPITMTNASVPALLKNPDLAKRWVPKILSRTYDKRLVHMDEKQSVTIGMGMTEKQGGTDVRANTTSAKPAGAGGEYLITGHKWFLSAPMCDAFLVLAQTGVGLTCFLVPRVLDDGSLNGLYFQRLKSKLGNRSNASSEVEFQDAVGWMVGDEGRGINTIIEMVTLTRLDCILASAGLVRWGLSNAVHHTRHRTVFQKKLIDQPIMAGVLADMALDSEAAALLAFRLAEAFDNVSDGGIDAIYARIMTPAIKYLNCKMVPGIANEAMECMGGNGYVEDGPMARLYREAPLNAIWEGSGNVMCLDLLRAVGRDGEGFAAILDHIGEQSGNNPSVVDALARVRAILLDPARAESEARFATEQLALAAAAALMLQYSSGDAGDVYAASRLGGQWSATYGTFGGLEKRPDCRSVVERVMPEVG